MKRIISVLLVFCLLAGAWSSPAYAYNTGDDYPASYKRLRLDAQADQWQFYVRECTSFAAHCLYSRNKVGFHNYYKGVHWGNARNWISAARRAGIPVNHTPKVGAIACYTGGRLGHVAWVRSVNGNNVTVEEYNWGKRGGYSCRTVRKNSFTAYIHVKDIVFYYLNVNMILNGKEKTKGYRGVTFDVTVNGKKVAHNVQNYYKKIPAGTSYKINNIKLDGCYELASKTSVSGKIKNSEPVMIKLKRKHNYHSGQTKSVATCTESGKVVYHCRRCTDRLDVITPALGHAYEVSYIKACDGNTYYMEACSVCHEKRIELLSEAEIEELELEGQEGPKKHIYSPYKITRRSTCDREGLKKKTCLVCGKEVKKSMPRVTSVKLKKTTFAYNKDSHMPKVVIVNANGNKLKMGRDYTVSYSHNQNVGTATAKIKLKWKYKGRFEKHFRIVSKKR